MENSSEINSRKEEVGLPEVLLNLSAEEFQDDWNQQYGSFKNPAYHRQFFYQAPKTSKNEKYSSKGWKVHIQFEKGFEEKLAKLLNRYGQYFKIDGHAGTWFNGNTDSGATVYVGSRGNVQKLVNLIDTYAELLPSPRNYSTTISGKKIYGGSGSDEFIQRGIAARFDVQKTEFKDKYGEYCFASFLEFRALPVLKRDELEVRNLEDVMLNQTGSYSHQEREDAYQKLYGLFQKSEQEVLKDFGKDFVYGNN